MLDNRFFDQTATQLAVALVGKVMRVKHPTGWLSVMIIETEAYCLEDKASHASLGYTEKRKALFMPPGTIYMYYARGADSLNISCRGEGSAVLIKSGIPFLDDKAAQNMVETMQAMNPIKNTQRIRPKDKLCSGQSLLCRSLGLRVVHWDKKTFNKDLFYVEDVGYIPPKIIQTTRLGIPKGRDEDLPYRFIDFNHVYSCTKKPSHYRLIPG